MVWLYFMTAGGDMKYQPAFDIWQMPVAFYKYIQRGQWVYAGDKKHKGVFLGVKRNGIVVVAWYENAKRSDSYNNYVVSLTQYAKGQA